MHLANSSDVHFCRLGERYIFLDVRRDRYFGTSVETADALTRALEGRPEIGSDECKLEVLVNDGLISVSTNSTERLQPAVNPLPVREFADVHPARTIDTLLALFYQLRAAYALRRRGFGSVINDRRDRANLSRPAGSLRRVAAAHRVSNLILARHQRCLVKSLGLFDVLVRAGFRPRLVLGVRDYPFSAHAWVQVEGSIIGDTLDEVSIYRPILVV